MRWLLHCTIVGLLALATPARAQDEQGALCRAAIRAEEAAANIPAGLMQAIARVESGRRDPVTGRLSPWPWTINAEGRGQFFQSREEAIAAVRQLQAGGMRSIDIGCMQVNLAAHPNAFASLEEAFDPVINARYAARFLNEMQSTRADWERTIGNYHSNTPERAANYRSLVLAALPEEQRRAGDQNAAQIDLLAAARLRGAMGVRANWSLANGSDRARMIMLSPQQIAQAQQAAAGANAAAAGRGSASVGRGLDAYRATPFVGGGMRPATIMAFAGVRTR